MSGSDAPRRAISVSHLATRLKVHPETIRRAIRTGELPAHRNRLQPGAPLYIWDDDAIAFEKARTGEA